MLLLAQVHPAITGILIAIFLFISVLMMLVVLIQRPAGGGLSGAFGSGAGSGQTAFGAKTGDALTMATIAVFVLYLLFAIGLNFAARPADVVPAGVPADPVPPAAPIAPGMPATEPERMEPDPVGDVPAEPFPGEPTIPSPPAAQPQDPEAPVVPGDPAAGTEPEPATPELP